jgi:ATP-dependent RNA helicase DeaD
MRLRFSSIGISNDFVKVLDELNIHTLTDIQAKTIPLLLKENKDFIGLAPTGTGKTLAYALPLLEKVDASNMRPQALILVPTRELAQQVADKINLLTQHFPLLNCVTIHGGAGSLKSQIKSLKHEAQIIVATPGRFVDILNRGEVEMKQLSYIVLDEADEMMNLSFKEDLTKILSQVQPERKVWLFSATMPKEVELLTNKYLKKDRNEVRLIDEDEQKKLKIEHHYLLVEPIQKLDTLIHFLQQHENERGIIFCRTKAGVQKMVKHLLMNRMSVGGIHGDLPQGIRDKIMDQFRAKHTQFLIATDIAARGIDIDDISFVMQYQLPDTSEFYTHRSGRTGRAGKKGLSLTFVFPEEEHKLRAMEAELGMTFLPYEKPSESTLEGSGILLWANRILKMKVSEIDPEIRKKVHHNWAKLSKDQLIDRLISDQLQMGG